MNRKSKLTQMKSHPFLHKLFLKLTDEEFAAVLNFVTENESLNNDDYMTKANRWYIDQAKPKHYTDMWAIVTQCVEVTPAKRR